MPTPLRILASSFSPPIARSASVGMLKPSTVSRPPADGYGLYGRGMLMLTPPSTLAAALNETPPYLVEALGQDETAQFTLESRIA